MLEKDSTAITLFDYSTHKLIQIKNPTPVTITGYIGRDRDAISVANMQEILYLVSQNKEISFEYQLLLGAYRNRQKQKFKYAIFDAASAFEVCLKNLLIESCTVKGVNGEKLLERKALGEMVDFLSILGIETDNAVLQRYKDKIVSPRNAAAHARDHEICRMKTDNLLEEAHKFLNLYASGYF